MKSIVFTISLLFVLQASAQIPNNGFEEIDSLTAVKNWGKFFITAVWIDSAGVSHTDSIVIDNQLYGLTTDAHSGLYALELRNGFNYTANEGISGGVFLMDPIPENYTFPQVIPIAPSQPASLTFYYKYFPVMNDSAMVLLTAYDANGDAIGTARTHIMGTVENYTMMTVPIVYSTLGTVTGISMNIENAIPGTPAHFGTRFLIDDLLLGNDALNVAEHSTKELSLMPNPANSTFQLSDFEGTLSSVKAVDLQGKQLPLQIENQQIDCTSLSNGTYVLLVETTENYYITKLVVRNN